MKKTAMRLCALLLCVSLCSVTASGAEYLIPVGQVIGLELSDGSVTVAALDDTLGAEAKEAGLQPGDKILSIDGKSISCAEDVRRALDHSGGQVVLQFRRGSQTQTVQLTPEITSEGPKLGIFLKQGVTGIGTVTWYDPVEKTFGTLGHGVNGGDGKLLQMVSGTAYRASVVSVKQGKCGEPGQLQGAVTGGETVGTLIKNTGRGLFGKTDAGWQGNALEVAACDDVKTGSATILSTIAGETVREYSVEILKIYPKTKTGDRNMILKVTDPALLESTGGIVQGMSGSPIIQDGKLVGAVTHVLVNDPTTGYGIFIENMLDAAA